MKKAILLAALMAACASAGASSIVPVSSSPAVVAPSDYALGGAPELRPAKVWSDPRGHLHLRYDTTFGDSSPIFLSVTDSGKYELLPVHEVEKAGQTEVELAQPVPVLAIKLMERQALVVSQTLKRGASAGSPVAVTPVEGGSAIALN
jgi:hypothetical protein